jgi:hypothetical protein
MILGKLWKALAAQMNKIANFFWTAARGSNSIGRSSSG